MLHAYSHTKRFWIRGVTPTEVVHDVYMDVVASSVEALIFSKKTQYIFKITGVMRMLLTGQWSPAQTDIM
jgi:hypothetical protein